MKSTDLSIIVPVKNDKISILPFVEFINKFLKIEKELIFVLDDEKDETLKSILKCKKNYKFISYFINNSVGPKSAVETGFKNINSNIFCIMCVDEIMPIMALNKMYNKIYYEDYDFISATRYNREGKRYGGNLLGKTFSFLANYSFNFFKKTKLSDHTTGIKMMKKKVWTNIKLTSPGKTWAFSFELSLKVLKSDYKVSEVSIISLDRIFGGQTSFKFSSFFKEYLIWYIWGLRNIKR